MAVLWNLAPGSRPYLTTTVGGPPDERGMAYNPLTRRVIVVQRSTTTAYVLDGDDLRQGLCSDLGLSAADRSENIRRAGEVARLMAHAGITVVCAFLSPFAADRQRVRALFEPSQFVEIFLSTSVQECARRDPKGLYAQAKAGHITGLTGWDGPYERPTNPEYVLDAETLRTDQMVHLLLGGRTPLIVD